jgi:hypothetical protein
MTVSDADVREALRRASDGLASPPSMLSDVRRGGRRRLMRRRGFLTAGLAVAVAGSLTGVAELREGWPGTGSEVFASLLDGPTRGDLADDQAYLAQVLAAFRRAAAVVPRLLGEPHIVWAGNTPAGPAAYVIQRNDHRPPPGEHRQDVVTMFLESTPGGPRGLLLQGMSSEQPDASSQAALLGPDRDVLLVLDTGRATVYAPGYRYHADGRVTRESRPVMFDDGAAVLRVPSQRRKITVAVWRPGGGRMDEIDIVNSGDILFPEPKQGVQPPEPSELTRVLPGAERSWGGDPPAALEKEDQNVVRALLEGSYYLRHGAFLSGQAPVLSAYGTTPDGRRLLVRTLQYYDDPVRVVALLGRGEADFQAVAGALVDTASPAPIRLRLPDRQGVFVAADGATLRYRINRGLWQPAGRHAALLPAQATEVEITRVGAATKVVPLG